MKHSNHHYNKELKEFARELRSETVSKAEKRIWKALLSRKQLEGLRFLRQRPIDNFIVDFFCPELLLIVEIDGNSHFRKPEYDRYRQDKLEALGYKMIRFTEGLVMQNLNEVHVQLTHAVHCLKGVLTEDKGVPLSPLEGGQRGVTYDLPPIKLNDKPIKGDQRGVPLSPLEGGLRGVTNSLLHNNNHFSIL